MLVLHITQIYVRRSISTKFCTTTAVIRAIISPLNFSDPINRLATKGHLKFGWKLHTEVYSFVICEAKQPYFAELSRMRTCIYLENLVRIVRGTRSFGAIMLTKFKIFVTVNRHPWADHGEIWHMRLRSITGQPGNSSIISRVKLRQTTTVLVLWSLWLLIWKKKKKC